MSGLLGTSSILYNVFTSSAVGKDMSRSDTFSANPSSVSTWSDTMTISSIRDQVDIMATSGQLTSKQQMSLIDAGLQDLNPYDKSYQPSDPSVGLNRKTAGTYDAAAIMLQKATFAAAHGGSDLARTASSLAALFEQKEGVAGLNATI